MAEGRKWKGYLCNEAVKAAAYMAQCPLHTLVKVRAGLRAGEMEGEGRVEEAGGMRGSWAPRRSMRGY